jgi:hypothetical protein
MPSRREAWFAPFADLVNACFAEMLGRPSLQYIVRGDRADLIFTDPPYNVPIEGHVSGLGRVHQREFAMACGEMTEVEFTSFFTQLFRAAADVSRDRALHYICMDWRLCTKSFPQEGPSTPHS